MSDLPKRDDAIYKEIESFADYELTQCLAYEMAIRNDEIYNSLDKIGLLRKYKIVDKIDKAKVIMDMTIPTGENKKDKQDKEEAVKLLSRHGFDYFECTMYYTERMLSGYKQNGSTIIFSPENTKITDILNKKELDEVCKLEIELFNDLSWCKDDMKIKNNESFIQMAYCLEYPFCEESEKIIKTALQRQHLINVQNKFSRPILKPEYIPIVKIDINLALPEDELVEYVKLLKKRYSVYYGEADEKNNKITIRPNTPLEFLGENLNNASPVKNYPKKPTAVKMADMFFVYDYVKARLKQIENENEILKQEYDEKIAEIKQSKSYDSFDKKIQLAELAKEHNKNIIDTRVEIICKEQKLIEHLDISNAKAYYYVIKPYIDDCKYKELLTGVSSI